MRIFVLLTLSSFACLGFAQSSSTHYKSVVRGSLTSGTIQSNSNSTSAVVNLWTEAHRQSSNHHVNRSRGAVHNPDSALSIFDGTFSIADLKVFPNPAVEEIIIQSETKITSIVVYDAKGQKIFDQVGGNSLKVLSWKKGLYLIHISAGDKTGIAKVIKH